MRAGEYGVTLSLDATADLTTATALTLRWRAPDTTVRQERSLSLPGSGTVATYVTQAADFANAGTYWLMLEAQFGVDQRLRSPEVELDVDEAIEAP